MWGGYSWAAAAWAGQPQYAIVPPVVSQAGVVYGGDSADPDTGYAYGGDSSVGVVFGEDGRAG